MILGSTSEFILAMIRAGRPARACARLALDQRGQPAGQVHGGDDQLVPVVAALRVAGQQVEEVAGVLAELGAAGEEAEVGVEPRGGRVVVAGAEVDVAADAVVLAADDQGGLAVGLEADDAVDDVDARPSGASGPCRCCSPRRAGPAARPGPSPACRSRRRGPGR